MNLNRFYRGAGRGAGASAPKVHEACDAGGDEQATQEKPFSRNTFQNLFYRFSNMVMEWQPSILQS
jgi:hypothetical protein